MFTSIVWILRLQKAEEPERLETEDSRHLLQVSDTSSGLDPREERLIGAALSLFLALSPAVKRVYLTLVSAHTCPRGSVLSAGRHHVRLGRV